ncbi:hypothetical protein Anapl_06264 [Anas platyrhynchos]|uniref:Uncharacterized protein n=1 Tax=Anas platyrhynchos TaxID=8839 RepID=R0LF44_ANAPL|nr:hypothetical protein Anapl_06264 [Anas platyrhynchos]
MGCWWLGIRSDAGRASLRQAAILLVPLEGKSNSSLQRAKGLLLCALRSSSVLPLLHRASSQALAAPSFLPATTPCLGKRASIPPQHSTAHEAEAGKCGTRAPGAGWLTEITPNIERLGSDGLAAVGLLGSQCRNREDARMLTECLDPHSTGHVSL